MSKSLSKSVEAIIPSKKDALLAEQSSRVLAAYIKSTKHPTIQLMQKGKAKEQLELPLAAANLLLKALLELAGGHAVSCTSIHSELTTQEAADMLNVSRPYLVQLLEKGEIPYRKVGTKRRLLAQDVLAYKDHISDERLKALAKLSKQAQDLDMGY